MSIVEKDSTGAVTDERLFIWAGLSILQERDGNNTITKKHFANGFENLSSGTQYYYTKDHLGSIREITDSTGTLVASYDYTPYGTRTLTSGTDISDFGYTGHFTHAKSGLLLAPYRAYDPQLGRWLSRDPIAENGGINLYAYVHNDPISNIDPLGLDNLNFIDPNRSELDANLYRLAEDYGVSSKYYTVTSHGSPYAIDGVGGRGLLSPKDLAEIIKNDPEYDPNKPVRLHACSTGAKRRSGKDNFAQKLANELGNVVIAPTDDLERKGRYFYGLILYYHYFNIKNGGEWKTFYPRTIPIGGAIGGGFPKNRLKK